MNSPRESRRLSLMGRSVGCQRHRAGMRIGANLADTAEPVDGQSCIRRGWRHDYRHASGHPTFPFRRFTGISLARSSYSI